jgi:ABC-type nitrate/sulfonate/bicarbonate transport system substrate-binding protein
MVAGAGMAPSPAPPPNGKKGGDPVDLYTGLFVLQKTDLALSDVMPLALTRTYRQADARSRAFGIGATHPYDMFLVGDTFPYTYIDLTLEDGGRVHYNRVSPGTSYSDAVYQHVSTPTDWYQSSIAWNGIGWTLTKKDGTVRVAINVWAGWAPIIYANAGFKPGKVWKDAAGKPFKVELVLIDDPVAMRDAFAAGNVHAGWATVDMLPLLIEGLKQDSRVMPRVFQQIDWSNGGDGIVVRDAIKNVADLRGKDVVLAQNSPSHYFLLNMLVAGGVQPGEVKMEFTPDAFAAAAAFQGEKDIAAAVSWSPDIYKLAEVKGNRMLVTTQTANKLIADVWFARADFAKDHMDKIESISRGIFDAMEDLKKDENKTRCAKLMADGYGIPASDTIKMFADAHNTNWAENFQFFLNQNNPTNFERVWTQATLPPGPGLPYATLRPAHGLANAVSSVDLRTRVSTA